jgi:hypothetical protein
VKSRRLAGILETTRVSAGIVIFLLLRQWSADLSRKLSAISAYIPPLMNVASVILSAAVVVFVANYVLGRPSVSLLWRTTTNDLPQSGMMNLQPRGQVVHLELRLENDTLLRRALALAAKRWPLELALEVVPADSLVMRIDSQLPLTGATIVESKIVVEAVNLEKMGVNRTIELAIQRRGTSTFHIPVTLSVSSKFVGMEKLKWVSLVQFDNGIEGFNLGGM